MKKVFNLLLLTTISLSVLCSCSSEQNPSNNTSGNNSSGNNSETLLDVNLEGYIANIENATALGIAQQNHSNAKKNVKNKNNYSDNENINYIYMSTEEFSANDPEANENGLTKVTFTKIITNNITTEITGTKYITAKAGSITIPATEGFKYSIYENESIMYTDVQDNDSRDKNEKAGVIVLDNLTNNVTYKVLYTGIGEEITLTQEEIEGEIDKLYVLDNYTFISYVPKGTSLRPSDNFIKYDKKGIALYDKVNYFSNNTRQSFVIDNSTGYIYYLKNFSIDSIEKGLFISSNTHYDMKLNDN
jgi:hypothetical protein